MSCPKCLSMHIGVRESRKLCNGTRRRRIDCLRCGHRWTTWDGPKPTRKDHAKPARKSNCTGRLVLTAEQVRFALVNVELNNCEVARQLGCTCEAVRLIRCGKLHAGIHPELPRPNARTPRPVTAGPSCDECSSWTGSKCREGFPDPLIDGLHFAADCDFYEVSQSISRV